MQTQIMAIHPIATMSSNHQTTRDKSFKRSCTVNSHKSFLGAVPSGIGLASFWMGGWSCLRWRICFARTGLRQKYPCDACGGCSLSSSTLPGLMWEEEVRGCSAHALFGKSHAQIDVMAFDPLASCNLSTFTFSSTARCTVQSSRTCLHRCDHTKWL